MSTIKAITAWLDANKGKITLVATFIAAGAAAIGYPLPDYVIAILATQGISTVVRVHAAS